MIIQKMQELKNAGGLKMKIYTNDSNLIETK